MEKHDALAQVKHIAQKNIATRDEVIAAYDEGMGADAVIAKKLGIAEILYYIGGGIVFIGIAILIGQNWSTLNFITKILTTLGASIAAYIVGMIFSREKKLEAVGSAFYLISALTLPIGLYVIFKNAGLDTGSAGTQSMMSVIAFGFFLASYAVFKKNIFLLFSILFGTWFYFDITSLIAGGNPNFGSTFFEYRMLVAGVSYLLFGYSFARSARSWIVGFLYGFGIVAFLGSALALGGWTPSQNIFWELIFPGLALGTLFIGIPLRSKAFLTFGSIFLMGYILKITAEYFSNSLGWPVALVFAGLMLIAVGYLYVYLRKRYAEK